MSDCERSGVVLDSNTFGDCDCDYDCDCDCARRSVVGRRCAVLFRAVRQCLPIHSFIRSFGRSVGRTLCVVVVAVVAVVKLSKLFVVVGAGGESC